MKNYGKGRFTDQLHQVFRMNSVRKIKKSLSKQQVMCLYYFKLCTDTICGKTPCTPMEQGIKINR